jgi:hypothetical protein
MHIFLKCTDYSASHFQVKEALNRATFTPMKELLYIYFTVFLAILLTVLLCYVLGTYGYTLRVIVNEIWNYPYRERFTQVINMGYRRQKPPPPMKEVEMQTLLNHSDPKALMEVISHIERASITRNHNAEDSPPSASEQSPTNVNLIPLYPSSALPGAFQSFSTYQ